MQKFLYYPGFEIEDEEWLKFALLYMIEVNTIIPMEADTHLSSTNAFLRRETNLLKSYRPEYEEGQKSSYETIEIIRKLNNAEQYDGGDSEVSNVLEVWRKPETQKTELYRTKFSNDFEDFCSDVGIGTKSSNGILIPKELSQIYMSVFAHNIADHKGMSAITDTKEQKKISMLNNKIWTFNPEFEQLKVMKQVISLCVPADLKNISIEQIVVLRNSPDFEKKLIAFHTALNDFTTSTSKRLSESNYKEFIKNLNESRFDLVRLIAENSTATVSVAMGVSFLIMDNGNNLELFQQMLDILPLSFGGFEIFRALRDTHSQQLAPRYLSDLNNLGLERFS